MIYLFLFIFFVIIFFIIIKMHEIIKNIILFYELKKKSEFFKTQNTEEYEYFLFLKDLTKDVMFFEFFRLIVHYITFASLYFCIKLLFSYL